MTPAERAACEAAIRVLQDALAADDQISAPAVSFGQEHRIKQIAALEGVHEATARRWAKRWGVKRGGVWFLKREAIRR